MPELISGSPAGLLFAVTPAGWALRRLTEITTYDGNAILTAMALIAILTFVLPKSHRPLIRMPLLFLGLHFFLLLLHVVMYDDPTVHGALRLSALFFLLSSIGRSGFLLICEGVLARVATLPSKIFLDIIQILIYVVVLGITLREAGVEPTSLITGSAVLTAVLGLALQSTLGNIFAGLAIHAEHPFEVGDWIQFNEMPHHIGRVIEINWRSTKVLTLDEVEVTFPNGQLANAPIRNFYKPDPWSRRSLYVTCPAEVPPNRVRDIILGAIADSFGVLAHPAPSVVTNAFTDRGIEYWIRFFTTHFDKRDGVDGGARDRIWYALSRNGIKIQVAKHQIELEQRSLEDEKIEELGRVKRSEHSLRYVDLFKVLPKDAIQRLAALSKVRYFAQTETIIRQGDPGDELFIIEEGEVAILLQHGDHVAEVARLGAGKFFGEMSLLTGESRSATVKATKHCQILVVGKASFGEILATSPDLAERISEMLVARQAQIGAVVAEHDALGSSQLDQTIDVFHRIKQFFNI